MAINKRGTRLATAVSAALLSAALARPVGAAIIIPSAPHAEGAYGSLWVEDIKIANPTPHEVIVTIYGTPAGSLHQIPVDRGIREIVAPNSVWLVEDVYREIHGDGLFGVDQLNIYFTDRAYMPVSNLPVQARVYNRSSPGEEFGMDMPVFDTAKSYYSAGTTIGAITGKAGERTSILVTAGGEGASLELRYTPVGGGESVTKPFYARPGTLSQDSLAAIFGSEPEPNSYLTARFISGWARVLLTATNNSTNDPTCVEMTPWSDGSPYEITVQIYVTNNGTERLFGITHPSEGVIKRIWQVKDLSQFVNVPRQYACEMVPDSPVNSLPEIIRNYNGSSAGDQQEFCGDRIRLEPYVNDSDNNGLSCDSGEPDHQFVNLLTLYIRRKLGS